jgi:Uncharacterized protein conserved in bacteria
MDIVVRMQGPAGWPSIRWESGVARCALGRAGIGIDKREGDGATPAGCFPLRALLYRPDRMTAPATGLPLRPIAPDDGWCDDPADPAYNRPVKLPYPARHERMWRDDGLYDLVIVVGHNDAPIVPGRGSAIFVHVAEAAYAPTAGCVALARADLQALVAACRPGDRLRIEPPSESSAARG